MAYGENLGPLSLDLAVKTWKTHRGRQPIPARLSNSLAGFGFIVVVASKVDVDGTPQPLALFQGEHAMSLFRRLFHASLLIVFLTAAVWAADSPAADAPGATDPPGRVARLQYMNGQVSVQPNGTDDWVQGSSNRPLTNADNIWADKDSRAELSLGTGLMRISSETSLTLTNVNTDSVQVSLHQGVLNVHVRRLESGEVWEVDTPNVAFTLAKSGEYRFDVDPDGDKTLVTVWKGEGEATGQGPAVRVHSGEKVQFTGGNSLAHESLSAPKPDGFDEWCRVRDERVDRSVSARYVAPGTVGYEDLDEYGTWRQTPEYGAVWVPTYVSPGWAPYSYGHWAWIDPWGWTWEDNYPWGFAPFHYGRWVSWGGYWGWAPGPYWVRPWYAPALVAWWGGPGWGFRFGFGGGFGWCPLGWGEPFFPWYHTSRFYFRNVNITNTRITNITNITNNYFNNRRSRTGLYGRNGIAMPRFATKPGAFTAASRNTLERGLPVRGNSARISPSDLRGATTLTRINATPTREARLGPKANMPAARPQGNAFSGPTVGRMTSPGVPQRTVGSGSVHSPESGAHSVGNTMARGPARGSMSSVAPGGHYVPRPPQSMSNSGSFTNRGALTAGSRSGPTEMAFNHPIPRPSQSGVRSPSENSARFGSRETPTFSRSVPRPPADFNSRGTASARNTVPSLGPSFNRPRGIPNSVPRPSGRVMPAPRNYGSPENRGGYSMRSYGGYAPSRGYSAPNYGGSYRGYSMPRSGGYSAPYGGSYGGRGGYSAPSHNFGGSGGGYHGGSGFHGGSVGSSSHGSGFHGGRR